jgi:hypothetical protein
MVGLPTMVGDLLSIHFDDGDGAVELGFKHLAGGSIERVHAQDFILHLAACLRAQRGALEHVEPSARFLCSRPKWQLGRHVLTFPPVHGSSAGPLSYGRIERMNLLRSICCLFGRCVEEPKPTNERPVAADLGQEEAELEKTGKEQLSHMESGTSDTQQTPAQRR